MKRAALALVFLSGCANVTLPGQGGRGLSRSPGGTDGGAVVSSGDSGTCAGENCAPLECGPGTRPVPLSGECCPTVCEPSDCSLVDCAPLACPSGTRAETPRGRCCPECVKSPASASSGNCDQGRTAFATFLANELSTLDATSCTEDGDCRLLVLDNTCQADCGTAVNVRAATTLLDAVQAFAADHCAACPADGTGCPPTEQAARCVSGQCQVY